MIARGIALALALAAAVIPAGAAARPQAPSAAAAAAETQAAGLPEVKHVFVIVLENEDYAETFGPDSKSPYLARQLPAQGQLLTQYYGIGHLSLDNYIAMVSGQAPNPQTQADCQIYSDFLPGVMGPDGQALGTGCVYPASVKTVADQLTEKGLSWGGYMEDMASTPTAAQTCRHPPLNQPDDTQSAEVGDQYAARHNPFVYFHSIIDSPDCAGRDVDLDRLPAALDADDVPEYVFISPNLCHDGHDTPCVDGQPGGLVSADGFLREWVPRILSSRAYHDGGLLVVTFDESESDASSCCVDDAPNTPNAGGLQPGPGGGRIGAVLLSPFIAPGTTNDTPYNHYSFLRTVEDLFGLPPLGYAARSTGFGADVFNGPTCIDHPLPRRQERTVPRGTLIARLRRSGRRLRITAAHTARIVVRARAHGRWRRVARRRAGPCVTERVLLPRGTRRARVLARAEHKVERRSLRVR